MHKIKRTLRAILSHAKKQRLINDNYASADYIDFPKRPSKEIDYMNDEDAKKFYAAADAYPDIRYKTAAMILLLTGMRRGELCGLERSNIDFKEATITIERSVTTVAGIGVVDKEPKTESSKRVIAISDKLLSVLTVKHGTISTATIWAIGGKKQTGCSSQSAAHRSTPAPCTHGYIRCVTRQDCLTERCIR